MGMYLHPFNEDILSTSCLNKSILFRVNVFTNNGFSNIYLFVFTRSVSSLICKADQRVLDPKKRALGENNICKELISELSGCRSFGQMFLFDTLV